MADPNHIVPVSDLSTETLQSIIALLEISTDFEHLVYREAELDAIWSITGFSWLKRDIRIAIVLWSACMLRLMKLTTWWRKAALQTPPHV